MIKIVIIEDEEPARRKLKRFLNDLGEPVSVIAELGTVTDAIFFLKKEEQIDLILSDIELLDGNAFSIYNEIPPSCPIIFTTAYNEFLMDAFETNGIEYLLKPFSFERFKKAWNKFLLLQNGNRKNDGLVTKMNHFFANYQSDSTVFKKRFSVNSGKGTYFLNVDNIVIFAADEGVIFAIDTQGKKHLLTQETLKEIESMVDPSLFFRINRSELVQKQYVERMERYTKNTLAITVNGYGKHLITSQNNTASFKLWIEQ